MSTLATDQRWMRTAVAMAHRNLGTTSPNPCVGCVIVRDNQLVGSGVTASLGRPHAETEALLAAGEMARGATAYVTLEPCAHQGETGPCADALIKAGVVRVVVGCTDPDSRVDGKGIGRLREAGIEVVTGVCEPEARDTLAGFILRHTDNRPFISLKLAATMDGKIAMRSGESQWITGELARAYGHNLRAKHDAILTGSGTYLADTPSLTCRLPGLEGRSPQPILLDRKKRCEPPEHWWHLNEDTTLENALKTIAEKGINRLLVEAGANLSAAFLEAGLVDRLYWFQAPALIGTDGKDGLGQLSAKAIAEIPRFVPRKSLQLGPDNLQILERQHD